MKLIHFLIGGGLVIAVVVVLIAAVVTGERDEQAMLSLLHENAMRGEPAALLAYCDARYPEGTKGGYYADCVARAQLEAFATASARWAGGE